MPRKRLSLFGEAEVGYQNSGAVLQFGTASTEVLRSYKRRAERSLPRNFAEEMQADLLKLPYSFIVK